MEAIAPWYTVFLYRFSKMFLGLIRFGSKIIKSHKKGIDT